MNKKLLSTSIVKTNKWWKRMYNLLPVNEKIMNSLSFLWILSINVELTLPPFFALYFTTVVKIFDHQSFLSI